MWGTDSIWYGSPQPQIMAFRAFQISPEFQARYGYPALTQDLKDKIFGFNAANLLGLDPAIASGVFVMLRRCEPSGRITKRSQSPFSERAEKTIQPFARTSAAS